MSSGYLRYPHVHGDLVTFVAGDDAWLAPAAGGRGWRLSADDVPVSYPRFSRDGARIAWTRAGPLWIATGEDPLFTRVLSGLGGQLGAPMLIGGRLFFLSDHEGTGNIYSCALDGGGIRRHTDHDGMYARNPATDGQRIVYHVAGDIWILDSPQAPPRRIEVSLSSPAAARAPRLVSAEDHLGSLDCDRTGQASVVEVRGTVHWLTHKDGPARALHVDPAARARLPKVLGDTGRVVWVTDASGPDALEVASVAGETQPVRLAGGLLGHVTSLAASPDGATVAVAAHDGRLLLVGVASGQVTELAAADDGVIGGLSWSPDSAWLAWSQPTRRPLTQIRIARAAGLEILDVTHGRFADTSPVFTADGLYLAFLSQRSFDPVYDEQTFDLSFPLGGRPYLVPLAAPTPSPFGPVPDGRPLPAGHGDDAEATSPSSPWTRTAWPGGWCPSRWRRPATAGFARSRTAWRGCAARSPACSARAARPLAAAGRHGGQAGRAHRQVAIRDPSRGGPAAAR